MKFYRLKSNISANSYKYLFFFKLILFFFVEKKLHYPFSFFPPRFHLFFLKLFGKQCTPTLKKKKPLFSSILQQKKPIFYSHFWRKNGVHPYFVHPPLEKCRTPPNPLQIRPYSCPPPPVEKNAYLFLGISVILYWKKKLLINDYPESSIEEIESESNTQTLILN